MMRNTTLLGLAAIFGAGTFCAAPASAQGAGDTSASDVADADAFLELDRLAEAAAEEDSGLALAQEQAGRGEFLEALATLERMLALHPKSQSARLLHAVYLCRIDDLPGGDAEIGKLKQSNFSDELWAQAQTICKAGAGEAS